VSFITNTGYDFELPAFSIYGASFSATSLDFSDVVVGVTISKVITVTNIGQSPINNRFSTSSVGFSETDDCPNPIPAGANCHITVSFQPVNTGLALGVISISAPFIPTGLPLRGIGSNITILPSRPTRLRFGQSTVVAGQSMDYSFALAMNDFNTEQVMLACDDLPPGVSCRIEPEQKVLTRSPSEFVVHITTTNDLDHSLRLRNTVNQATSTPTGSYTIHLKVKSSKGDLEIPIPMTVK
jgi:hypothetical protein